MTSTARARIRRTARQAARNAVAGARDRAATATQTTTARQAGEPSAPTTAQEA